MTPEDDFLVAMGLESAWVTPDAAEALIEAGLVEYGLFQDPETRAIEDGLELTDGTTPEAIWEWLEENDEEAQ